MKQDQTPNWTRREKNNSKVGVVRCILNFIISVFFRYLRSKRPIPSQFFEIPATSFSMFLFCVYVARMSTKMGYWPKPRGLCWNTKMKNGERESSFLPIYHSEKCLNHVVRQGERRMQSHPKQASSTGFDSPHWYSYQPIGFTRKCQW